LCFLRRVPDGLRPHLADDVKLLLGWTFDAAAAGARLRGGEIVDAGSGFATVPGFAGPTAMGSLRGRYRVLSLPFDDGRGYYGIAFAALGQGDSVQAIVLASRLFRLLIVLQQPVGLLTDILSNLAMFTGIDSPALTDARAAAADALVHAEALITVGQSQAGGMAQLQIMALQAENPTVARRAGFITFNAAYPIRWPGRLGIDETIVEGVNFSKDLDPGFGPAGLIQNRIGIRLYVHRDGTIGSMPGDESIVNTWIHARQHFLDTFNEISLSPALESVLRETESAASCGRLTSGP
jgi:hypothetical protein